MCPHKNHHLVTFFQVEGKVLEMTELQSAAISDLQGDQQQQVENLTSYGGQLQTHRQKTTQKVEEVCKEAKNEAGLGGNNTNVFFVLFNILFFLLFFKVKSFLLS